MVLIPTGRFEMGISESDMDTLVNMGRKVPHMSLNHASWNDARSYAEWAEKRLSTETEWEYAAIGGRDVRWFPWGNRTEGGKYVNFRHQGESFFDGIIRMIGLRKMNTMPVGNYPPNGYGLHATPPS